MRGHRGAEHRQGQPDRGQREGRVAGERDDDADNTLRAAFGNEASDRDIDDFARRFGCRVVDGFGSTELAIIIQREAGTPPGSVGRGADGVAIYDSESVTECAVALFDEHGALTNADQAKRYVVVPRQCDDDTAFGSAV